MDWVRILKNIPRHLNEERSDQLSHRHQDGWRRIYLSPSAYIVCPDDALVISTWRFHAFSRGGRAELLNYLALSDGCGRLLDVGASAGIFSALFANTHKDAKIISVEPDGNSFRLLAETVALNSTTAQEWRTANVVLTDKPGVVPFSHGRFGGSVAQEPDGGRPTQAHSLPGFCGEMDFVPDIVKIDVESWEYEILASSLDFLAEHQPRLHLEVHWLMIEGRGHSPEAMLRDLAKVGYRCGARSDLAAVARAHLDGAGCARLGLIAQ